MSIWYCFGGSIIDSCQKAAARVTQKPWGSRWENSLKRRLGGMFPICKARSTRSVYRQLMCGTWWEWYAITVVLSLVLSKLRSSDSLRNARRLDTQNFVNRKVGCFFNVLDSINEISLPFGRYVSLGEKIMLLPRLCYHRCWASERWREYKKVGIQASFQCSRPDQRDQSSIHSMHFTWRGYKSTNIVLPASCGWWSHSKINMVWKGIASMLPSSLLLVRQGQVLEIEPQIIWTSEAPILNYDYTHLRDGILHDVYCSGLWTTSNVGTTFRS